MQDDRKGRFSLAVCCVHPCHWMLSNSWRLRRFDPVLFPLSCLALDLTPKMAHVV
jgi:hypothetical protein